MTKQEEIRKVIDLYTDDDCLYLEKDCEFRCVSDYCRSGEDAYKCLMERLDEIGVVIKVEQKEPIVCGYAQETASRYSQETYCPLIKGGSVIFFEPLIEECIK